MPGNEVHNYKNMKSREETEKAEVRTKLSCRNIMPLLALDSSDYLYWSKYAIQTSKKKPGDNSHPVIKTEAK